jgi:hypothetical protein
MKCVLSQSVDIFAPFQPMDLMTFILSSTSISERALNWIAVCWEKMYQTWVNECRLDDDDDDDGIFFLFFFTCSKNIKELTSKYFHVGFLVSTRSNRFYLLWNISQVVYSYDTFSLKRVQFSPNNFIQLFSVDIIYQRLLIERNILYVCYYVYTDWMASPFLLFALHVTFSTLCEDSLFCTKNCTITM